jgi:hypothetical protein
MIRVDIKNFCNIREAHLHDDSPMSLIVGYNESGKSNFIGGIEYVFTGSAFGLRGKDVAEELVTHGESGMHIRTYVDGLTINRSPSSGDAVTGIADRLGVPAAVMPLLFNSSLCGDGGDKAMRVFLDGVASSKFDAVIHFATDPNVSHCIAQARKAGKLTTKQTIEYCESLRAAQKEPAAPMMPIVPNPTADEISNIELAIHAADVQFIEAANNYTDLDTNGRAILAITQHYRDMETYEKLRAMSEITDPLGDKRQKLEQLANINVKTLAAIVAIIDGVQGYNPYIDSNRNTIVGSINTISQFIGMAKEALAANPPPPSAPRMPVMAPEIAAVHDSLHADGLTTNGGLAALSKAAYDLTTAALEVKKKAQESVSQLRLANTAIMQNRAAWSNYSDSLPHYEAAKAKATADWKMWDDAGKQIAAAETEHINKAGDIFGSMVSEFSGYVLQGRKVVINRDTGVSLGGVRIGRCSKSAQWRMEVSIMAAVARMLKSPLLIIDAADILDERNKTKMQEFLLERIVPFFKHVIITATCRGKIEDERPSSDPRITKWTMKDGQLNRLAAAAAG